MEMGTAYAIFKPRGVTSGGMAKYSYTHGVKLH